MAKKYKSHTPSLKVKVALEAAENKKTINQIASEYEVSPSQVTEWKNQLLEEAEGLFQHADSRLNCDSFDQKNLYSMQILENL